jgi:hypothetical protein
VTSVDKLFDNLLVSSPNGGGLYFVHEGRVFKLDNFNTTGLSVKGRKVFRGIQPARIHLYDCGVTESTLNLITTDDIHDVYLDDDACYVVGTSRNEIIKLNTVGEEIERWIFPGEDDARHINCLAKWNGRIVFSAFGEFLTQREYKGKTGESGFVQDLLTGEHLIVGLSQPHSLLSFGENLLLANSEHRELMEFGSAGDLLRSQTLDGYTRGICVVGDIIYVGLSCSRNIENPGIDTAAVVALDRTSWVELGRVQIPTKEIYSIQGTSGSNETIYALANIASTSSSELVAALRARDGRIASLDRIVADAKNREEKLRSDLNDRDKDIQNIGAQSRAALEAADAARVAAEIEAERLVLAYREFDDPVIWRIVRMVRPVTQAGRKVQRFAASRHIVPRRRREFRKELRLKHDVEIICASGLFDPEWYLRVYPDVAAAGEDPLIHYLRKGVVEGRNPNPRFNTDAYLRRYPDVAAMGLNPLVHYAMRGATEKRDPGPSEEDR